MCKLGGGYARGCAYEGGVVIILKEEKERMSVGFIPSIQILMLKINEFPHRTFQHTLVHAALRVSTAGNV